MLFGHCMQLQVLKFTDPFGLRRRLRRLGALVDAAVGFETSLALLLSPNGS